MEASVCRRSQWIRSFLGSSECCILLLLTRLSSKGHRAVRGWGGGRFPENTETSVQNQGARCWGQDTVPPRLFWEGGGSQMDQRFLQISVPKRDEFSQNYPPCAYPLSPKQHMVPFYTQLHSNLWLICRGENIMFFFSEQQKNAT